VPPLIGLPSASEVLAKDHYFNQVRFIAGTEVNSQSALSRKIQVIIPKIGKGSETWHGARRDILKLAKVF
jgi:hypothetical protein